MTGGLLGYAFALGVLAAVNPCGFVLLPVYMSQFVAVGGPAAGPGRRVRRAMTAAGTVAAGFVIVFAAAGAAVTAGMAAFMRWVPWAMVVVAAALVAAGVAGLARRLSAPVPRWHPPGSGRSPRSMFAFGVGYALASTSCALPVFLAGVAGAFVRARPLSGLLAFLAYAAGMSVVLTGISLAVTLGRAVRLVRVCRWSRWFPPAMSLLLVLLGAYLLVYWLTSLLVPGKTFLLTGLVDSFQAAAAGWLGAAGWWVGVGIATALALAVLVFWLRRHLGGVGAVVATLVVAGLMVQAGLLVAAMTSRPATSSVANSPLGVGSAVQQLTALTLAEPPRAAPEFSLEDQHGKPVSLGDLRGKAVVLAFVDDRGQDIDLLYPPDVHNAATRLGPLNQRVEFVGINVNAMHASVADIAAFTDKEGLDRLPNWHFLTGTPDQLRRVWAAYGVFVGTQGTAVSHDGVLWFLDPQGRQRAIGSVGASAQATDLWGQALAAIARALLDLPVNPPDFGQPQVGDGELSGVDVRGGGPAPDWSLPRLAHPDDQVSLAARRGETIVLNFWASWCPPCRREMPDLQAESLRDQGRVTFIGIDVDDEPASAQEAANSAGLTYTLLEDAHGQAAAAYRVVNLPTTLVIAPDGTIALRHTGVITPADLRQALDGLLPES